MHYYETITVDTVAAFLYEVAKLTGSGFDLIRANADKHITFDGKNTIECNAKIFAILIKGTAIYTVVCAI
jgi:hypothetical protein